MALAGINWLETVKSELTVLVLKSNPAAVSPDYQLEVI